MDSPGDAFPELPRVADSDETSHHEFGKVTETGNDGKTSTANRPQQMCYHGVFIRFGKRQWQVVGDVWRSAFGEWVNGRMGDAAVP